MLGKLFFVFDFLSFRSAICFLNVPHYSMVNEIWIYFIISNAIILFFFPFLILFFACGFCFLLTFACNFRMSNVGCTYIVRYCSLWEIRCTRIESWKRWLLFYLRVYHLILFMWYIFCFYLQSRTLPNSFHLFIWCI